MVHIADREGDIYELFDKALEENTNFLVRVKVNRRVDNNLETINNLMKSSSVKGKHQLSFIDKFGNKISTTLALKFEKTKESKGPHRTELSKTTSQPSYQIPQLGFNFSIRSLGSIYK